MKLTRAQVSELSGKSKQSIYKAVKSGRIKEDADRMLDTDDPDVLSFIGENNLPRKDPKSVQYVPRGVKESLGDIKHAIEKQKLLNLQQEYAEKTGDLVSKSVVDEMVMTPLMRVFSNMVSEVSSAVIGVHHSGGSDGDFMRAVENAVEELMLKNFHGLK